MARKTAFHDLAVIFTGETGPLMKATKKAMRGMRGFARGMIGIATRMGKRVASLIMSPFAMLAGVAGAGALLAAPFKFAISFETGLAKVSTLLDDMAKKKIPALADEIKKLSAETGKSTSELLEATYQALSSNVPIDEVVKFIERSTKAAIAGFAQVDDVVRFSALALKAYGGQWEEVDRILNIALKTQNLGVTTFAELAQNMGSVVPIAAQLGVEMTELFGATATLTGVTGNTAEVATQLKGALIALLRMQSKIVAETNRYATARKRALKEGDLPAAKAIDEEIDRLRVLATSITPAAIRTHGLRGALQALIIATRGSEEGIFKLTGRAEAYNAIIGLTGKLADVWVEKQEAIADSAGTVESAYKTMSETLAIQLAKLWNSVKNIAIEIGTPMIQRLAPIFGDIARHVGVWTEKNKELIQSKAVEWFEKIVGFGREMTEWDWKPVIAGLENLVVLAAKFASAMGDSARFWAEMLGFAEKSAKTPVPGFGRQEEVREEEAQERFRQMGIMEAGRQVLTATDLEAALAKAVQTLPLFTTSDKTIFAAAWAKAQQAHNKVLLDELRKVAEPRMALRGRMETATGERAAALARWDEQLRRHWEAAMGRPGQFEAPAWIDDLAGDLEEGEAQLGVAVRDVAADMEMLSGGFEAFAKSLTEVWQLQVGKGKRAADMLVTPAMQADVLREMLNRARLSGLDRPGFEKELPGLGKLTPEAQQIANEIDRVLKANADSWTEDLKQVTEDHVKNLDRIMNPQRRLAAQAAARAGGGIGAWRTGLGQFGGTGQLGLGGGIGAWTRGMASRARRDVLRQAPQTNVTQNTEVRNEVNVHGLTDLNKVGEKLAPIMDRIMKQATGMTMQDAVLEIKRIQAKQGATA